MTESTAALRHHIHSARDLQSVVRTMRALAASSIHQYEQSVLALTAYRRTIEQGLGASLRAAATAAALHETDNGYGYGDSYTSTATTPEAYAGSTNTKPSNTPAQHASVRVIVFGSDQGLVGSFNETIANHAIAALHAQPAQPDVWAVGERVRARLSEAGIAVSACYSLPHNTEGIAPLVNQLLLDAERQHSPQAATPLETFHHRPLPGALYTPVHQRLLPLDAAWRATLLHQPWPTTTAPHIMGHHASALRALIREHLFICLFQACAESLASENASRLSAMQRADQNIDELLTTLQSRLHRQRQSAIDEELFDVTAGYVALSGKRG